MSDELLQAMCEAYWKAAPGITSSMRNILELLHANGYRRCAEGQRVTQWCDRAEKAEAEVERLRHDIERHMALLAEFVNRAEKAEAERDALRAALEALVNRCNADFLMATDEATIAAEAALERAYLAVRGES